MEKYRFKYVSVKCTKLPKKAVNFTWHVTQFDTRNVTLNGTYKRVTFTKYKTISEPKIKDTFAILEKLQTRKLQNIPKFE